MNSTITFDEKFVGILKQFVDLQRLYNFGLIKNICKNWYSVSTKIAKGQYPLEFHLRDGRVVTVDSWVEVLHYAYPNKVKQINRDDKSLLLNFAGKDYIISGYDRGDIASTFVLEDYRSIECKGKVVIDIGAGIADSCIYFAARGAKKVIGFEPYPLLYQIGCANITRNSFEDAVILVNAGCGVDDVIHLDANIGYAGTSLRNIKDGVQVPIFSLSTVTKKFSSSDTLVLKIDCEGCEYDLILKSDDNVLARFDEIMLEYHYGGNKLAQKLRDAGFNVTKTWPKRGYNNFVKQHMYIGYIHCKKLHL